ncbi:unnamed protein product [Anisakis simplex]|uniref:Uncharacterized protein n=1 Tax=Anisakis simplex TaxID=6269 RepID=A0A3P6NDS3_ANISI|nr:unnamed protein product [Anisakis simplex]
MTSRMNHRDRMEHNNSKKMAQAHDAMRTRYLLISKTKPRPPSDSPLMLDRET